VPYLPVCRYSGQHSPQAIVFVMSDDGLRAIGYLDSLDQVVGLVVLVQRPRSVKLRVFDDPVQYVIDEAVLRAVFIHQFGQTPRAIVAIYEAVSERIDSPRQQRIGR